MSEPLDITKKVDELMKQETKRKQELWIKQCYASMNQVTPDEETFDDSDYDKISDSDL